MPFIPSLSAAVYSWVDQVCQLTPFTSRDVLLLYSTLQLKLSGTCAANYRGQLCAGESVASTITDAAGRYALPLGAATAVELKVRRIGFFSLTVEVERCSC